MYNTSASELESIANDLGQIARSYTSAAQELDQQVITLEGAVSHVLSDGVMQWKGLSSEAFVSAWLERRVRLKQASTLMSESVTQMTTLAQTIESNIAMIRAGQSIQLQPIFATMPSNEQQSVLDGVSQAQNAIFMAVAALNSQLEAMAAEVSNCPEVDREAGTPGYYDNAKNYAAADTGGEDASGDAGTVQPSNEELLNDPLLIQKEEMIFEHSNEKDALDSTLKHLEQAGGPLPDDFEPTPVKVNPGHPEVEGLNNGMGDRERGWRIDFDEKKGIHFNWYDWSSGSRKSGTGRWGAETFPGTYEDYLDLLLRFNVDGMAGLSS